jgi:hypothetical protein
MPKKPSTKLRRYISAIPPFVIGLGVGVRRGANSLDAKLEEGFRDDARMCILTP